MPFIRHLLSFSAGELSPWLDGRTDLDKYAAGARQMLNLIPLPQGGVQRRPGMEYLGNMVAGSTAGRLVEFQTSTEDAGMLVIGGGKIAVWVNGVPALDGGLPIELVMPWSAADLEQLRWKQINDVMWLVHPLYAPRKLVRYAADDWELTVADVDRKPPLLAENLDDGWTITTDFTVGGSPAAWSAASVVYAAGVRVTHSGKTWVCQKAHTSTAPKAPGLGTATYSYAITTNGRQVDVVTKPLWAEGFSDLSAVEEQIIALTSNRNTWVAGHVGSVWEISKKREGTDFEVQLTAAGLGPIYSPTLVIQGGWSFITFGTWQGKYSIEKSEDRGATWKDVRAFRSDAERNIETEGAEDLRCLMRIKWDRDGLTGTLNKPLAVLSSTDPQIRGLVKITAVGGARAATAEVLTPVEKTTTYLWKEGAWSAVQGYPRTVELHQARIVMGGTTLKPHTIFGSAIDDYDNFYPGTDADQGYRHTVAIGEKDPILWLVSERFLLIGTGAGEWVMHGEDEEKAITPEFGVAKRHSSYGSHNGGVPACFADSVSLFVQRGGTRVREFSYRYEADRYEAANLNILADHLFTVPVDDIAVQRMPWQVVWFVSGGALYGLTYERAQNVAAWHRHETAGDVLSVACIRSAGTEDEVWFLVDRGQGNIFIERFRLGHMDARPDDGWWQDSAVAIATPTDLTGAEHLDGLEATAWIDGEALGPVEIDGTSWPFATAIMVIMTAVPDYEGGHPGGYYLPRGTRNGRTYYEHAELGQDCFIQWSVPDGEDGFWLVVWFGEAAFTSASDVATPDLATGWTAISETVEGNTFTPLAAALLPGEAHAFDITGITGGQVALNARFFRRGIQNTKPYYLLDLLAGSPPRILWTGSAWQIRSADGVTRFSSAETVATPDLVTTWTPSSASGTPLLTPRVLLALEPMVVGLPYTWALEPMIPEIPLANGSSRGREGRIHRVTLSLRDTRGAFIGEELDGPLDPVDTGTPGVLYSGEHEHDFDGGHAVDVPIVVTGSQPYPCAIRSLALKMNVFGDE